MRSAPPTLPAEELRMNSAPPFAMMIVKMTARATSTRPISRLHLAARQKTSEAEAGGVQAMVGVIGISHCWSGKRIMRGKGVLSDNGGTAGMVNCCETNSGFQRETASQPFTMPA